MNLSEKISLILVDKGFSLSPKKNTEDLINSGAEFYKSNEDIKIAEQHGIADKIFITFIFVGFTYIERVSIWITVLLIVREFIITGLRGLAGNEGIMIPPSKLGKAKASLQFWAIGFVMMDFPITLLSFTIADFIVFLALVFSYISGYQYISGYLEKTK